MLLLLRFFLLLGIAIAVDNDYYDLSDTSFFLDDSPFQEEVAFYVMMYGQLADKYLVYEVFNHYASLTREANWNRRNGISGGKSEWRGFIKEFFHKIARHVSKTENRPIPKDLWKLVEPMFLTMNREESSKMAQLLFAAVEAGDMY